MCLLVFAWQQHSRYRLVFAGNRDEFHDRPAAPLHWWRADQAAPDARARSDILAGRDLLAAGTWLGLSRGGRFGVVTNYRDMQRPVAGAPSRGELLTQWLSASSTPSEFAAALAPRGSDYAGFNLLLADDAEMVYASNRAGPFARRLEPGVYGLSNHLLDTPWPKLARTRKRFAEILVSAQPPLADLEQMLADRQPAADAELPATGLTPDWERMLSAPFIVDTRTGAAARYGTRCTTVVLADETSIVVRERRFDAAGRSSGMEEVSFGPIRADAARA